MEVEQKEIINSLAEDLVDALTPVDLLPSLTRCLTAEDREKIACDERNDGYRRATQTLLDRLKKRRFAFEDFINALKKHGFSYLAERLILMQGMEMVSKSRVAVLQCSLSISESAHVF